MAQQTQASGYSTAALLLAAGSSALAGLALGYTLAKRELAAAAGARNGSRSPNKLRYGVRLSSYGGGSADSTPAATPRSLSRQDSALSPGGLRMVLLVRTDLGLSRQEVAEQAARAVLGIFKKQFKRRDPNLRPWEEAGHRIKVLGVGSQADMLQQQAAARSLAIPTHTFAGSDRALKQRTVMVVGPAPADTLEQMTGHFKALAG